MNMFTSQSNSQSAKLTIGRFALPKNPMNPDEEDDSTAQNDPMGSNTPIVPGASTPVTPPKAQTPVTPPKLQ
jgi:hypothetical protein